MASGERALVTPAILRWARRESRHKIPEVARHMDKQEEIIESWENGTAQPTINQAKKLAKFYKQMFATFFLDEDDTPTETVVNFTDYRTISGDDDPELSPKAWSCIREALKQRQIALELAQEIERPIRKFSFKDSSRTLLVANSIRASLGIETPKNFKTERDAFNYFRGKFEEHDILVFQMKGVEVSELRGVSIFFDEFPIILVNSDDAWNGRIFTMFHELAHLIKHNNSLSTLYGNNEVDCNRIAGETLLPPNTFDVADNWDWTVTSKATIKAYMARYGVSEETFWRRLLILDKIDESFYQTKRAEIHAEFERIKAIPKKKKDGSPTPNVLFVSQYGNIFPKIVLQSYLSNKITLADTTQYFRMQPKFISAMKEVLFK